LAGSDRVEVVPAVPVPVVVRVVQTVHPAAVVVLSVPSKPPTQAVGQHTPVGVVNFFVFDPACSDGIIVIPVFPVVVLVPVFLVVVPVVVGVAETGSVLPVFVS